MYQGEAKCIRIPNKIIVRSENSKTRKPYFTFATVSATTYILAYLNDRFARGEPLHGDLPIIDADHRCRTTYRRWLDICRIPAKQQGRDTKARQNTGLHPQ